MNKIFEYKEDIYPNNYLKWIYSKSYLNNAQLRCNLRFILFRLEAKYNAIVNLKINLFQISITVSVYRFFVVADKYNECLKQRYYEVAIMRTLLILLSIFLEIQLYFTGK